MHDRVLHKFRLLFLHTGTSDFTYNIHTYLSQNSGETQDLKGVSSDAVRVIAAFAGTVASRSDFDVDSTAFRPLFLMVEKEGLRSGKNLSAIVRG